MKNRAKEHLTGCILPFWKGLADEKYGGFYGYKGYDLVVDKTYEKGCILHSRILWFFSNVYLSIGGLDNLKYADHAYEFIKKFCLDKEYGGILWSVTYDGKPKDTTKHTYNQAFAIYALSSYYDASKCEEALLEAFKLFEIIEEKCRDEGGYLEAFDREFCPVSNEKLSENGVIAIRTMNTLLHVLEAYTELYRVSLDERVLVCLKEILKIWADKMVNKKLKRQEVFFDHEYNSIIDLHSYGHDIETSWLLDRTLDIIEDRELTSLCRPLTQMLCGKIYERAYMNHSLINECENGVDDEKRVWWVQAETVIGFINGYQRSMGHREYMEAAEDVFDMIMEKFVDRRNDSEWFHDLDKTLMPLDGPIVEPWKCPYHNGRMTMEIIRRM